MQLCTSDVETLTDTLNIGVGRAGWSLSELLGVGIDVCVPSATVTQIDRINDTGVSIARRFDGVLSGSVLIQFTPDSARDIAGMLGSYDTDARIPELELSGILSEVCGVLLRSVIRSVAATLETQLQTSPCEFVVDCPVPELLNRHRERDVSPTSPTLVADAEFSILNRLNSAKIIISLGDGQLESLLAAVNQTVSV